MTEWSADHILSEKNEEHTVLAHYSFDLRRHLWNTMLGITWQIIMAELMVALSALGLVILRRRRRREKSGLFRPSHTLCWFASTPPIRMVIEQKSNPPTADTLRLCKLNLTRHCPPIQKLPTQLNTLNRFVPELIRVSPDVSDIQSLRQCVPALMCTFFNWSILWRVSYWNIVMYGR